MTCFGYTLMTEQSGPKELVRYAVSAERAGFDFEVSSDHYFPWLASQGHAPYAWSVLGAVAQATDEPTGKQADDLCLPVGQSGRPVKPRHRLADRLEHGGDGVGVQTPGVGLVAE